jgi:hypothetical protein
VKYRTRQECIKKREARVEIMSRRNHESGIRNLNAYVLATYFGGRIRFHCGMDLC